MNIRAFRRCVPANLTARTSAIRPAILVAAAVVACSATGAMADIVGVGGGVVLRDPPADISNNRWTSDTEIRGWFERQLTLSSSLSVDHVNSGLVNNALQLVPGSISAGTAVQTYMFRLDPTSGGENLVSGFVRFDTPIIGLILTRSALNATDATLGRPGVSYNQGTNRGMDFDSGQTAPDTFEISADRLQLNFTMIAGQFSDDIRVVTQIPSPSAAALLGLGGLMAARRRR